MKEAIIQIKSGGRIQQPAVLEGITLERSRSCEPSKLVFTCIKDRGYGEEGWAEGGLSFAEGCEVIFSYGNTDMFRGRVFEKRRNKDHHIEVTCYDNLRYGKNEENYVFTNIRLDQIVTRIAQDLEYPLGHITKTNYVIPKFIKTDSTILDVLNEAIGQTSDNTGIDYVLYDDCGRLCLKSSDEMMLDLYIDKDTFSDFEYGSSIDSNTFNRIVVQVGDKDSDHKELIIEEDRKRQEHWGLLQKVIKVGENAEKAKELAKFALIQHCRVTRSLTINNQFGDVRVRGGSGIYIDHSMFGDLPQLIQKMWVHKVTHKFDHNDYYMDLTLTDERGFFDV